MNPYIGHRNQVSGVEEFRLVGGKGDGMRLYEVCNGLGIELTVTPDRNGDITRLRYKGIQMNYMSPCGYVSPAYYDSLGTNWLKSFTAGFLTTCGLDGVGTPCVDNGEEIPLHGQIANQPCSHAYFEENDKEIIIHTCTNDEMIFGRKFVLNRRITVSKEINYFDIVDTIENTGDQSSPFEILYHMNMGYPLLDENSVVNIPSTAVKPRDEHAEADIDNWMKMGKPQAGYQERCYYHEFKQKDVEVTIYQPKLGYGLSIQFDSNQLDGFVEWKMMGIRDYVLGLECGNCYPDGRDVMRKKGMLKFLNPGQSITYKVGVKLLDNN